jgi:hypothetical protein
MGDGDGRRVVVVISVRVYNDNFSFSTFVMIRGNKNHTYRLGGAMPPSPSSLSSLLLSLLPPRFLLLLLLAVIRSECGGR